MAKNQKNRLRFKCPKLDLEKSTSVPKKIAAGHLKAKILYVFMSNLKKLFVKELFLQIQFGQSYFVQAPSGAVWTV